MTGLLAWIRTTRGEANRYGQLLIKEYTVAKALTRNADPVGGWKVNRARIVTPDADASKLASNPSFSRSRLIQEAIRYVAEVFTGARQVRDEIKRKTNKETL